MKEINDRITPIYMGSTRLDDSVLVGLKDHPHIHGEHRMFGKKPFDC